MGDLIILCHLEHLTPYDLVESGQVTQRAYSLNLSVAAKEKPNDAELRNEQVQAVFQIWKALQIEKVAIYFGANAAPAQFGEAAVKKQFWRGTEIAWQTPGTSFIEKREKVIKNLKTEFAASLRAPDSLVWKLNDEPATAAAQKPWHTFVGQAAQFPVPIPQLLNLSLIFYLDANLSQARKIVAAPILKFDFPNDDNPAQRVAFTLTPEADATKISDFSERASVKIWDYKFQSNLTPEVPLPANVKIHAYVEESEIAAPAAGAFLDLQTLWVKRLADGNGKDLANFGEDWRVLLESRMADAFDLSQRITEHLREEYARVLAKPDNDPERQRIINALYENLPKFRQMFLASLRDICGIGVERAPDNQSLLELLTGENLSDKTEIIRAEAKSNFPDIAVWQKFIAEKLPSLSKLSVLQKFDELMPIPEAIAELERLHQAVLEPANLTILVREQWRKIFADKPELGKLKAVVDVLKLNEVNLRRALAMENVGIFWRFFVGSGLADAAGKPLVKEKFACFFLAYGLLRFGLRITELSAYCAHYPSNPDGQIKQILPAIPDERIAQIKQMFSASEIRENLKNGAPPLGATDQQIAEIISVLDNIPHFNALAREYEKLMVSPPSGAGFEPIIRELLAYIKKWSEMPKFAEKLVPPPLENATVTIVKATDVPHPVTIMVDKLDADPDENAATRSEDFLSRVSGIGILMREQGREDWRCLNMAEARVNENDSDGEMLFVEPVLVPLRLNYLNELRQSFITYNNHPLAAKSPVAKMTSREIEHDETAADSWQKLISYFYSVHPDAKLSPLKFSASYELLPFIVGNSGVLPAELSRSIKAGTQNESQFAPGEIDLQKIKEKTAEQAGSPTVKDKIRTFKYLRKVKIGHIRASGEKTLNEQNQPADGTCLNLPAIPENVYPRFRDMKIAGDSTFDRKREQPLLLLPPPDWNTDDERHKFAFSLKLPATDLNTWDRWAATGKIYGKNIADAQTLRKNVWTEYHKRLDLNSKSEKCVVVTSDKDATLDDPALLRAFCIELFTHNGSDWNPSESKVISFDSDQPLGQTISAVQTASVPFVCQSSATAQGLSGDGQTITVKEKGIYKLKISCCLPVADYPASATAKFDNIYGSNLETVSVRIGNQTISCCKVSPLEMFIEVATAEMPTAVNLQNWLRPEFVDKWTNEKNQNIVGDAVEVRLQEQAGTDKLFDYVYKIELKRQMWRWQGRETTPHPRILTATGSEPSEAKINRWEAKEYGNRFDSDHVVFNMNSTVKNEQAGSRVFLYREYLTDQNNMTTGKLEKHKEDLRALHYRFKATAFSRYAVIMPPEKNSVVITATWKSRFVPCRVKDSIKPPKIKLIFPLTQSFGAAKTDSAGLLAVLDEPWYEIGGIGETLGAEIAQVPDPRNDPQNPQPTDTVYFEIGNDPIISSAALNSSAPDKISAVFDNIRGPVGHTFDRSSDAPLLATTSFIIPAPTITLTTPSGGAAKFGAWGMCKLRLKRIINIDTDETKKPRKLGSDFTDPFWVQYLPEFSVFREGQDKELNFDEILLQMNSQTSASVVSRKNAAQRIKVNTERSEPTGSNVFQLYLVLTREVFDATGRADQEVYLGVLAQNPNSPENWTTADVLDVPANTQDVKLRARIVEVQRRKILNGQNDVTSPYLKGDDLWMNMFKPEIADHLRCRIVRISEPIYSQAAIKPKC